MGVFHKPYANAHPSEGKQYKMIFLNLVTFHDTYEEAVNAYRSWWEIKLAADRFRRSHPHWGRA